MPDSHPFLGRLEVQSSCVAAVTQRGKELLGQAYVSCSHVILSCHSVCSSVCFGPSACLCAPLGCKQLLVHNASTNTSPSCVPHHHRDCGQAEGCGSAGSLTGISTGQRNWAATYRSYACRSGLRRVTGEWHKTHL